MVTYGLKQVYRYRNHSSKNYCNFLGKVLYKKGLYPRELFCETVKIPFETVNLRVPKGLSQFLTRRFGDYMKLPSPEKRKVHPVVQINLGSQEILERKHL